MGYRKEAYPKFINFGIDNGLLVESRGEHLLICRRLAEMKNTSWNIYLISSLIFVLITENQMAGSQKNNSSQVCRINTYLLGMQRCCRRVQRRSISTCQKL